MFLHPKTVQILYVIIQDNINNLIRKKNKQHYHLSCCSTDHLTMSTLNCIINTK